MTTDTAEETDSADSPAAQCINYEECGNEVPGGTDTGNMICDACLDDARSRGRGHGA